MKIRTDFVTNSSSSSFVVDLNLQLLDGTSIIVSSHKESGDLQGSGCSFIAKDCTGETIASGECDPFVYCQQELGIFAPYEIPYEVNEEIQVEASNVNLIEVSGAKSINDIIEAVKKPFGLDSYFVDDEDYYEDDYEEYDNEDENEEYEYEDDYEEYEYEDERAAEIIGELKEQFNTMVDDFSSVMTEHLENVSDLVNASVSMEFYGRGEFLEDPAEIIGHIFNWQQNNEIVNILIENDEKEILEKLGELKYLKKFSSEALSNIVYFWKNCDCAPDMCNVKQTLRKDGKIDLTITWE